MSGSTQATGMLGEDAAALLMRKEGFEIVCRNFRTRFGEIDIIARDSQYIVFAEVKTRSAHALAAPREAVGLRKQQRIIHAAEGYLAQNGMSLQPRFDVIEVFLEGGEVRLRHIPNAFSL